LDHNAPFLNLLCIEKENMIIIELFAGVGGFRLGLEGYKPKGKKHHYSLENGYMKGKRMKKLPHEGFFITGLANQYEPSTKTTQHAAKVYLERFNDNTLINEDVDLLDGKRILDKIKETVPKKRQDEDLILVGGFPCQDYSVAGRLDLSKGMKGKKGVLWWNIYNILTDLKSNNRVPKLVLLENVDRLIKSPANARGRDFMTLLHCLHYLGYDVEYMVINAGEYGYPQRRKRVFILANQRDTQLKEPILKHAFPFQQTSQTKILELFEPNTTKEELGIRLEDYNLGWDYNKTPFQNYGSIKNGILSTFQFSEIPVKPKVVIKDLLQQTSDGEIGPEFYVDDDDIERWEDAKKGGKIKRTGMNRETGIRDYIYNFSVGTMATFDSLDKPFRTIITSEGGKTPSRTKHLIKVVDGKNGKFQQGPRRLTPLELERANCFPDNFTRHDEVSDSRRAFLMGNALVIGVVERIRNSIINNLK